MTCTNAISGDTRVALRLSRLVVQDLDALMHIEERWLELQRAGGLNSPNADLERFVAVVQGLQGRATPFATLWYSGAHTHAGLLGRASSHCPVLRIGPVAVRGPRLRVLDVVYGGLISPDDTDTQHTVIAHFQTLLDAHFDIIVINRLPMASPIASALLTRPGLLGRMVIMRQEPHWVFVLAPGPFSNTMQRFSKKRRNELAREGRRLAEQFANNVTLRVYTREADLNHVFKVAEHIVPRTYHGGLTSSIADTPVWREQLALEARRGRLRAFVLLGDDEPIAFNVGSVYGNVLVLDALAHLPRYARYSPGKYLLLKVIEHCSSEGLARIDYGFGDAEYKRVFGTACTREAVLAVYASTWSASVAYWCACFSVKLTWLARGLATRFGALRWLRERRRRRLTQAASR